MHVDASRKNGFTSHAATTCQGRILAGNTANPGDAAKRSLEDQKQCSNRLFCSSYRHGACLKHLRDESSQHIPPRTHRCKKRLDAWQIFFVATSLVLDTLGYRPMRKVSCSRALVRVESRVHPLCFFSALIATTSQLLENQYLASDRDHTLPR